MSDSPIQCWVPSWANPLEDTHDNRVNYPSAYQPSGTQYFESDTGIYYTSKPSTGTVDVVGTAVSRRINSFPFDTDWVGYPIYIGNTWYYISAVADIDNLTLSSSAGTHSNVAYSMPSGRWVYQSGVCLADFAGRPTLDRNDIGYLFQSTPDSNNQLYRWDWAYGEGDQIGSGVWTLISSTKYKGPWDNSTVYDPWDIVTNVAASWLARVHNVNIQPGTITDGGTYWVMIGSQGLMLEKNGYYVPPNRRILNLIEGSNVTLTVADNPTGTGRMDVTISADGGTPYRGHWNFLDTYHPGDIVIYDHYYIGSNAFVTYVAIVENVNTAPTFGVGNDLTWEILGFQGLMVEKNGLSPITHRILNLIEGANVTITEANNAAGRVDVTIAASGGGGATGPRGATGPAGAASSVSGATGPQGPQGYQGPQGIPGEAAAVGATGATGAGGGEQGPPGPQGEMGPSYDDTEVWQQITADHNAIMALSSGVGATGATGPQGPPGADSFVSGPPGETGPAGEGSTYDDTEVWQEMQSLHGDISTLQTSFYDVSNLSQQVQENTREIEWIEGYWGWSG